jgi:hypothetical protein
VPFYRKCARTTALFAVLGVVNEVFWRSGETALPPITPVFGKIFQNVEKLS